MNARERAQAIITDILVNHLPRIKEGLEKGYVDENQILIVYDHAVRARVLQEYDFEADAARISAGIAHEDNLAKINKELEAELEADLAQITDPEKREFIRANMKHPLWRAAYAKDKVAAKLINVPVPGVPCGVLKQVDEIVATQPVPKSLIEEIQRGLGIVVARSTLNYEMVSYVSDIDETTGLPVHTAEKGCAKLLPVEAAKRLAAGWTKRYADQEYSVEKLNETSWKLHVEKHACICGGVIHDLPTGVETILKCDQCGRTFLDEFELSEARKNETKGGTKCPDATYWTTGTLAGGTTPVPMETEINLNGRKAVVRSANGTFTLTYEQIVRMTMFQDNPHTSMIKTDAELPMLTCTYHHRVEFSKLPGERSGSLCRGQKVEVTPGMSITCIATGNA